MLSAAGISPAALNTRLSDTTLATPLAVSSAPPVEAELLQPWPVSPKLKHGQIPSLPSPAQVGVIGGCSGGGSDAKPFATTTSWDVPGGSEAGGRNSVGTGG